MSNWRVARSLLTLRQQIDNAFPQRDKRNDGTIGDEAHQSRASDHNPWVDDGVVTALDITHDPKQGVDCEQIVEQLRASRDVRIKYIIWNGRICNYQPLGGAAAFQWRKYHGKMDHTEHFHISVRPNSTLYDKADAWLLNLPKAPPPMVSMRALKEIAAASRPAAATRKG